MSGAIFRRGRRVTLRLVVSDAAAFAWRTVVVVRSIELAFPVVHDSMVDAVSEYEVIVVDVDVASVNVGAPVYIFAQELELGGTKVRDVEVGPECLNVGHVKDVHLSHVSARTVTLNQLDTGMF